MVQKFVNLKQKILQQQETLCLGNISKDQSTDNMKKTGLTGYVYDFSADYNAVTIDDIKDIHNYLMKKMIQCKRRYLVLLKKVFALGLTVLSSSITVH